MFTVTLLLSGTSHNNLERHLSFDTLDVPFFQSLYTSQTLPYPIGLAYLLSSDERLWVRRRLRQWPGVWWPCIWRPGMGRLPTQSSSDGFLRWMARIPFSLGWIYGRFILTFSSLLKADYFSQDWMDQGDYMVWHGWQQMLGGSSMGYSEQWCLLEGLLQEDHGDMSRTELKELTDRIMQMNKELGAGDDGRVQEVTETSTTTTTTTSSSITQQQRYETADAFLQVLNTSAMGFTLEQAKQKAIEIREGRLDSFVTNHLEKQALKAMNPQPAIQTPVQPQIQTQLPPPAVLQQQPQPQVQFQPQPQVQVLPPQVQQIVYTPLPQQQIQSPQPQIQQQVYTPQPQQQFIQTPTIQQQQQQLYTTQYSQQYVQAPLAQTPQTSFSPQTVQSPPVQQPQVQMQPLPYQQGSTNNANTTTTSTTTTTTASMISGMQGMALNNPSQTQVQSPMPQQQYVQQPQRQLQSPQQQQQFSPMVQQQPQLTYPGHGGLQALPVANFNNQQVQQSQQSQPQTPLPMANFNSQRQAQAPLMSPNLQQTPQTQVLQTPMPWIPTQQTGQPAQQFQQQLPQQMVQSPQPQQQLQQQQQFVQPINQQVPQQQNPQFQPLVQQQMQSLPPQQQQQLQPQSQVFQPQNQPLQQQNVIQQPAQQQIQSPPVMAQSSAPQLPQQTTSTSTSAGSNWLKKNVKGLGKPKK